MREQGQHGDQACAHDQRLRHRCIPDRVRIRGRAVGDQVYAGDCAEPGQAVLDAGNRQPGGQETGCLRALTGRDDYEHLPSIP